MIGEHRVGAGQQTFIIAEAGVNHDGDVDQAFRLVDAAVHAGADAVKFQMFRAEDLATAGAPTASYQRENRGNSSTSVRIDAGASMESAVSARAEARGSQERRAVTRAEARGSGNGRDVTQREMLAQLELSDDAFARIKRHCDERSILFLATPFGLSELERLVAFRPAAIKIASSDLTNTPLVAAAAGTALPIILSVGASTADEIDAAVAAIHDMRPADDRDAAGGRISARAEARGSPDARHIARAETRGSEAARGRLILLHCVSCYPTPIEAINLRAIAALAERFGVPCGLSDHTTSTRVGSWAVAAGACLLEKHLTLDRSAPGPDHAMSLSPGEFREYVALVSEVEAAMGSGRIGMTEREAEVRAVAGRSVVAARNILAGTVLTRDMLNVKRPGTGLNPSALDQLLGRVAVSAIPSDTLLSWEMVR